jgi:curved DNA-binding protein CbpA
MIIVFLHLEKNTLVEFFCNSEGYPSAEIYECKNGCENGKCLVNSETNDLTPRISSWWGKVNQHTENGIWKSDPDGRSGATLTLTNAGRFSYCQKWYPETVEVREYAEEYIVFNGARNEGEYLSVRTSYECVQLGNEEERKSDSSYSNSTTSPRDLLKVQLLKIIQQNMQQSPHQRIKKNVLQGVFIKKNVMLLGLE